MKRRWKQAAGFTLVELIVVIAILGILAGVAVPTYSGYVAKANEAADNQLLTTLNTAYNSACIENGEFDMKNLSFTPKATLSEDGAVTMETYHDAFQRYFGTGAFKYFDRLIFVASEGVFKGENLKGLVEALKGSWDGSSFKDEDGTVMNTLLGAFDGIGGFFAVAAKNNVGIEEYLLKNVPDVLADALGLNGMVDGYNTAVNLTDDQIDAYLAANISGYADKTDEEKATLRATYKGNLGVLYFAEDAASRSTADVQSSVDNFMTIWEKRTDIDWLVENVLTDEEYLEDYYYSTLDTDGQAWFDNLTDIEKETKVQEFCDNTAVSLGDLTLNGVETAALAKAAEQSGGSNTAGVSMLGSLYALSAGYYNSDIYKNSTDYDPNYTPNYAEFGSFLNAVDSASFRTYYEQQGTADLEAYLSFMSYLSTNTGADLTGGSAFTGQSGFMGEALGYSN